MFFCKKAVFFCCIILCTACHHSRENSVNFAGSEYWKLQSGETVHPLDEAIFSLYEKYQFLPSNQAPLSKYIHANDYNVFICLLNNSNAQELNQWVEGSDFLEYQVLAKDSVSLSAQNQNHQSFFRYLLQKVDTTYLYSVAYDTQKFNFSILINIVTKDSSLAYQYFKNPEFMAQRLGDGELIINH